MKTEHYRAVIGQTLHNASGVALENEVAWVFRIKEPNRWIRRSDGAWEDPLNWSDREVPVAGDLVVIDPPNHNLVVRFAQPFSDIRSIRCTAGLDVAGGRLRVESDSVIAHLILSGGILMPTGQLDVATRLDWTSGTLEADDALTDPGTGSLNLLAGTTGEISRGPGGAHITRSVLNNAGTLVVSGRLLIDKEPVINNLSTGRLEFAADDALMFNAFGGGGITVNNTGILRKTGGTNEAGLLIKGKLNNSGRIEVLSGNLALGDSSISGPIDLEVDTYISFFGNAIIQPGTAFTGRGQPRLFGQLTLQADIEIANISLGFGTLTGPGRLTIIGDSEWNQATITGDGVVEVAPSGRLNIAPGFALAGLLDGRTVNNRGTIRVFKTFYGINGATINNLAEGRVELIGDVGFTVPSFGGNTQIGRPRPAAAVPGAPAGFNNFGTLVKTAGSGASRWEGVILSNAGLIDLSFGSLEILRRSDSISDRVINPLGDAPRSAARPAAPGDRMFLQTDAGQITFAIHGTNGPTEFGRLRVEDTADLGGGVRARFTKGVIPAVGQAFPVLEFGARNGDFSHLVLESTPSTGLKLERFFELQSMRLEVRAKP